MIALAGLALLAGALAAALTYYLCSSRSSPRVLDFPNERSLHVRAVPRTGGLAIVGAVAVALGLWAAIRGAPAMLGWIGGSAATVAVVSYWDDRFSLSIGARIVAHALASALLVAGGFAFMQPWLPAERFVPWQPLLSGLAIVFVMWMTNLYNFMDGMDGFAAGMAVIGFATLAVLGWRAGHESFGAVSIVIAAACAGFLIFNFPPARIFLGDVGSTTLGFLAAALSLWGDRDAVLPLWAALLLFSPFIADATVTLLRRLLRGEKFWRAHKTHYYQRLVQAGWGHRRTVLLEYAIMLGCAVSTLWVVHLPVPAQVALWAGWVAFYAVFFAWVARRAARHCADSSAGR